jgi:hypothetical protein
VSSKRRFLRVWAIGSLLWIAAAGGALRRDYDLSVYLTLHDAVSRSEGPAGRLAMAEVGLLLFAAITLGPPGACLVLGVALLLGNKMAHRRRRNWAPLCD